MDQGSYYKLISEEMGISPKIIASTARLFDEGATIPFISRYRKEITGAMDEVQLAMLKKKLEYYAQLEDRKVAILESIEKQGKLTEELKIKIDRCLVMTELEDLYLPYKQKRKTRAVIAIEKGLEPLAKIIFQQGNQNPDKEAAAYISEAVPTIGDALQGARDIIAEWVNEDAQTRQRLRGIFSRSAIITSKVIKGKEEEGVKFSDYFDWEESLKKCPSHRLLAMQRGENEGFLRISIRPEEEEKTIESITRTYLKTSNANSRHVETAIKDSYKRLLAPSIENEIACLAKEKADTEAIMVFAENLKQLLLSPPLGAKRVLGIDPGFRTGCKVVIVSETGELEHYEAIFPHPPQNEYHKAAVKIAHLVEAYRIDAISIGNGTAGRETERFIKTVKFDRKVQVFVVNESGASIYSASEIGREEFPEYDVTVRGAVSIARRLIDPLAELVKIDPKSIGVGQYQHDVDQGNLKKSLDQVVENCVNMVGVDVNTASPHLLAYVSGLGPQLAKKIAEFRAQQGGFKSRNELKKVPRLGEKAFEQCAGFLRIRDGINPLDNTAVHPESYGIVSKMAANLQVEIPDLLKNNELQKKIDLKLYVAPNVGLPTLNDIMAELSKPGRDPRSIIKVFEFAEGIHSMEDLQEGMVVPGIVTNITNFGAFVDIGVHQDGLVHISQLRNSYVSNPADVVKLNQHVKVKIISVDLERKRIQLSMKDAENDNSI